MKRTLIAGLLSWALAQSGLATDLFYVNDGIVSFSDVPPQIDAINFVNNNTFDISIAAPSLPYATANTLNYTNYGAMSCPAGFLFETYSSQATQRLPAANFRNNES